MTSKLDTQFTTHNKLFKPGDSKHAYYFRKYHLASYNRMKELHPGEEKQWLKRNVLNTAADYNHWKRRLQDCNNSLENLKTEKSYRYKAKDFHSIGAFSFDIDTLNERLFYWRSYYQLAKEQYAWAKRNYKIAQNRLSSYYNDEINKTRIDYDEFVKGYEYNAGNGECKGFRCWLETNLKHQIEDIQFKGHAVEDVIGYDLKRTYNWWLKMFRMYQNGELPQDRDRSRIK